MADFWFNVAVIACGCCGAFFLGFLVGASAAVGQAEMDYGELKAEEMRRERERILG